MKSTVLIVPLMVSGLCAILGKVVIFDRVQVGRNILSTGYSTCKGAKVGWGLGTHISPVFQRNNHQYARGPCTSF